VRYQPLSLPFEKWHGAKNDFLVVRLGESDTGTVLEVVRRAASRLCDRHAGVGADGVLVLVGKTRDDPAPGRLVILNSDGSEAKNCGNGLRCAAASIVKRAGSAAAAVELSVEGRKMTCRLLRAGDGHADAVVAVDLGAAKTDAAVPWRDAALAGVTEVGKTLRLKAFGAFAQVADLGNPHVVVATPDASADLARRAGPLLQRNDRWPAWDGINVHLVKRVAVSADDQRRAAAELGGDGVEALYQAFVWERGAGETMACGTGVGAIAAVAWASGAAPRGSWVAVDMPGGRLYARQDKAEAPVTLAGPAAFICRGEVDL
jgi:diaminopimelate epimerase